MEGVMKLKGAMNRQISGVTDFLMEEQILEGEENITYVSRLQCV
jgi:hypothetical protein